MLRKLSRNRLHQQGRWDRNSGARQFRAEAIKAPVANHFLETELEKLRAAVSTGYARGSYLSQQRRCRVIRGIGMIERGDYVSTSDRSGKMALLKRELCRQVKGPEVTHADRCTLVFDTDAKNLYIEREVAHLDASVQGAIEIQTAMMDIADYLKQGGQTAGHRELWRLLRTLFKEDSALDESVG